MHTCSHWDVTASGECPLCHTSIVVTNGVEVSVALGSTSRDLAPLTSRQTLPGAAPSARVALASALGLLVSHINIVDVWPSNLSWEQQTGVTFTLAGSKVEIGAVVSTRDTLIRTPERVEFDEWVEAAQP